MTSCRHYSQAQSESWGDVGSFLVATGPANTDEGNIEYHKTTAFQMRLFEYELPGVCGTTAAQRGAHDRC